MEKHGTDGPERGGGELRRAGLIEFREAMGWLQSDVAERSGGLGNTEISRIETGINRLTTIQTVERAARGYCLSVRAFRSLCEGRMSVKAAVALAR